MKSCSASIDGITIAKNVSIADSFFKRLKGLLLRNGMEKCEGLLLKPCKQVHSIGMKFCFDIVFLDKENKIIYLIEHMKPGKVSPLIKKCCSVLELGSGAIKEKNMIIGKQITFD